MIIKILNAAKRSFLRIKTARNIFGNRVFFIQKFFLFFSTQHSHSTFLLHITLIIRINITFIILLLLYSQRVFNAHKVLYAIIDLAKIVTATKANMIRRQSEGQY